MRSFTIVSALLSPLLFGCSDATGSLVGGDLVAPAPTGTSSSGGSSSSGGGPATLLTSADCLDGGTHTGSTWDDLYTCYFGPTGPISCAGANSMCHADMPSLGGGYWVCGLTKDSCYTGMTGYSTLSPQNGSQDPTMNGLYTVLCGSGSDLAAMPLGCSHPQTLLADDFTRIAAWIQAKAPNN
jgi:hypothetical protein